eukprot:scaffold54668_cov66-Phaeocystis_antarctica.AAC.3
MRPPKEPRGRDLEGGGAQAHGQAVEHAHADGLSRSEDGARPAEEGEGGGVAEKAAAQDQPWREAVEGDAADEQRRGPGEGPW